MTDTTASKSKPVNLSVGQVIVAVAKEEGVDPILALAQSWNESGLSPTAEGDPYADFPEPYGTYTGPPAGPGPQNEGYTSFGLYQLHYGGELTGANLTPQEAFNPITNARVALSHVGAVARENPQLSPGQIAAVAGGPANPQEYANVIDGYYKQIQTGNFPPGFVDAYNAPSGETSMALSNPAGGGTGGIPTDVTSVVCKWDPSTGTYICPPGTRTSNPQNPYIPGVGNSGGGFGATTSGGGGTAQPTAGFLHTLQGVLNPGVAADVKSVGFSLVTMVIARATITIVGAMMFVGGLALIVVSIGGGPQGIIRTATRGEYLRETGSRREATQLRNIERRQRIEARNRNASGGTTGTGAATARVLEGDLLGGFRDDINSDPRRRSPTSDDDIADAVVVEPSQLATGSES